MWWENEGHWHRLRYSFIERSRCISLHFARLMLPVCAKWANDWGTHGRLTRLNSGQRKHCSAEFTESSLYFITFIYIAKWIMILHILPPIAFHNGPQWRVFIVDFGWMQATEKIKFHTKLLSKNPKQTLLIWAIPMRSSHEMISRTMYSEKLVGDKSFTN